MINIFLATIDQKFMHYMNSWKPWYLQAIFFTMVSTTLASFPIHFGHMLNDSIIGET